MVPKPQHSLAAVDQQERLLERQDGSVYAQIARTDRSAARSIVSIAALFGEAVRRIHEAKALADCSRSEKITQERPVSAHLALMVPS